MEPNFATEDIKNVFSKIMQFMDDSDSENEEIQKPSPSKSTKSSQLVQPKQNKLKEKSPKPLKSTKTVSVEQFNKTTYARWQTKQLSFQEKIKRNTLAKEAELIKELKEKPNINKDSQKITQKPIFERYEGILKEKQKKITELHEKLQNERTKEVEKELTFQPNLGKSSEKSNIEFSGLLDRMKEWEEKKNMRIEMIKDEAEEKMKESMTFRPTICENSVKIMEGHGTTKDVAQRLFEHKKAEVNGELFKFIPTINANSVKMTRTRSEAKVFERLFEKSKED